MTLRPDETELRGRWVVRAGKVAQDAVSERIKRLIREDLTKLGGDASGWDVLYFDPVDGRYWELLYLESHVQGGGPPTLRWISPDEAKRKYGAAVAPRSDE